MKIKRFFAAEMREAIRLVKEELGPDAVILSNNKVDGGIELVAAIDYDEQSVQRQARSTSQPEKTATAKNHPKRSMFAKVRNPNTRQNKSTARLEDSIKDDVISFSSQQHNHFDQDDSPVSQTDTFGALFKQSSNQQSARQQNNRDIKEQRNAFSKPSLAERKQPFISEFENDSDHDDNSYPFDYESLVKAKQQRARKGTTMETNDWDMDQFFSDTERPSARKNSTDNNRQQSKKNTGQIKSRVEWVEDPVLTSMKEEIQSLRGILENQLSGLAWGDFARRHPHRAELLSRLYRLGLKSSLSEKMVKQLKTSDSMEDSWRHLLGIIARNIPTADIDPIDEGGIIALVGPTGVGKTTNIAKLAARFTLKYGAKELALVTTDSYRVGAHEQLKTYGRILGVPVYTANDENELKQVLSRLDDKRLVLIDTAGMSHRDVRLAQQLNMLRRSHNNMKILAVLSAASQTLAMDEVIKTFNASELDGCIASKVDESTSIGGIISILIENQLQLNYISDGQKVPEDIHQANTKVLLKQALEMVRQHPVSVKNDELAMSYSAGGLTHAFG